MSNLPKRIIKNYIKDQSFSNSNEVLAAIKEMFRDVLIV